MHYLRIIFLLLALFFVQHCAAQNDDDFLAKQYLNDNEFEKALVFYERLIEKNPRRADYAQSLIVCYQQLEQYNKAETFIQKRIDQGNHYPALLVQLGYNHTLKEEHEKAKNLFELALNRIDENPNYGYSTAVTFQSYSLLDYALRAFKKSMELNPKVDYNYQVARIYGEQGKIEQMFSAYFNLIINGKTSKSNVLRSINDFVNEDPNNENNIKLKRTLLQNAQQAPDVLWNEMLSWLFVKQRQFNSAFRQEKAIFKRSDSKNMARMEALGNVTLEANEVEIAQAIFKYITKNALNSTTKLNAQLKLIDLKLNNGDEKVFMAVQNEYQQLLENYGLKKETLQLQIAYANFLTFKMNTPVEAITLLKQCLELPLNARGTAFIKLALGDILVYDKKFNQALIYFTQIQKKLKNDVLGQNARFKVAQTSFYKGDFDWALTQLKVLRSSTSQLIANDAMQLSLLISDNTFEDSTQTALKKYARADLLAYQNKTKEAVAVLDEILLNHKGEKIEDEALLKQGELFIEQRNLDGARLNFHKIVEFYSSGILADDAHFKLAEMYRKEFKMLEKAKTHYEKIIFNYQDSYYYPAAVKQFRALRGDSIN